MTTDISTKLYSAEVCNEMNKYHSYMKRVISANIVVLEHLKEMGIAIPDQTIEQLRQNILSQRLYKVHPEQIASPKPWEQMYKPAIIRVCKDCGQEFRLTQDYIDRLKTVIGEKFVMPCRCRACKQALATKAA